MTRKGFRTVHLIFRDDDGCYFIRIGLGIFWECSSNRKEAKEFTSRNQAAKVLRETGKAVHGWRVISDRVAV